MLPHFKIDRSASQRINFELAAAPPPAGWRRLDRVTVGKWRRQFLRDCIKGLPDEAGPGRPRTIAVDQVAASIEPTLRSAPGRRHQLVDPTMADATGFSHTSAGFGRHSACSPIAPRPIPCLNLSYSSSTPQQIGSPAVWIAMKSRTVLADFAQVFESDRIPWAPILPGGSRARLYHGRRRGYGANPSPKGFCAAPP